MPEQPTPLQTREIDNRIYNLVPAGVVDQCSVCDGWTRNSLTRQTVCARLGDACLEQNVPCCWKVVPTVEELEWE